MKVLHIWDVAGIGTRLARYVNENGLGSSYVVKRKSHDKMNICSELDCNVLVGGRYRKFILSVIYHLIIFRPDIIHVHGWDKGVLLGRLVGLRTFIIMHYHGTDIRGKDIRGKVIPGYVKRFSSKIIVSTKDLLRNGVEYYGYPVN